MTCHPRHRTPKPENKLSRAKQRSDWPTGQSLSVWKEYLGVTDLFDSVAPLIAAEISQLNPCEYELGIWYVDGSCRARRTNYIGVDVAREFPGEIGITVFLPATDRIGDTMVRRLRDAHGYQPGTEYYERPSRRHTAHTFFLIPSLDYWNEHQQDFAKLAANINAAI